MCIIGINLNNITPEGTTIVSATGKYQQTGASSWVTFPIDIENPTTPDFTNLGTYTLKVSVTNDANDTSDWSNAVTITVTNNCGETLN